MTPNVAMDVKRIAGDGKIRLIQLLPGTEFLKQWLLPTISFLFIIFWTLRLFGIGATARCMDTTYSYTSAALGTCSWHGGVMEWLR